MDMTEIIELEKQVAELKEQLKLKDALLKNEQEKNSITYNETQEAVYMLRTREAIRLNESVYKIGKTTQKNMTRFNSYSKGYALKCYIGVYNATDVENALKYEFKKRFVQRTDIGIEYFEGSYVDMRNIFWEIANKYNDRLIGDPNAYATMRNERIALFLREHVKVTNHKHDKIKRNELWNHFKQWHINNYSENLIATNENLIEAVNKKYNEHRKGNFWINMSIDYDDYSQILKNDSLSELPEEGDDC